MSGETGGEVSARAWYGPLIGGLLPILLLGFVYSALADRTVFALWALVAGALWVVLLRQGLAWGWPGLRRAGSLLLLLAAAFGVFAALESAHGEILDLGFRAVFPAVYHPLATRAGTAGVLAAILGIAGAAVLVPALLRKEKKEME
ncbi:MAG TPA: hypothetical protein VF173_38700 [Thermoanaerobaculia bacterium]|nr:hypothetical protein [Thermoanaerobaculia bacterium]